MVTSLKRDGKNFVGEAKVMSTPMGKIVENIMDDGGKLAVSLQEVWVVWNRKKVQTTLKTISTWQPLPILLQTHLHLTGDVEGIMEGKEWIWDNGILKEVEIAEIQEDIERNIRSRNAKYQALNFAKFLKKL